LSGSVTGIARSLQPPEPAASNYRASPVVAMVTVLPIARVNQSCPLAKIPVK
jgi:hypothetical protein